MRKKKGLVGIPEIIIFSAFALIIVSIALINALTDKEGNKKGNSEYPTVFAEYVREAAEKYDIEEERIYAVIKVESDFNPDSRSVSDARGLMQMLPSTYEDVCNRRGEEFNAEKLFDPEVNIDACTYYLKWLYERLGNWTNVHIAYNAGIGNVNKWLQDNNYCKDGVLFRTPSDQANAYIERINYYYNEYKN